MYNQKAPSPASEITREPSLRVEPISEYTQTNSYPNKTTPPTSPHHTNEIYIFSYMYKIL